jgi:hypothetical protein
MKKINLFIILGVVLLLAGCSSLAAPTAMLEASATEAIPTQITITPSRTSIFTPKPSLTFTQTMTQTLEPFSTETLGECKLPCWWGITPGETTWVDALNKLENQKLQLVETEIHSGATESKLLNGLGYVWVYRKDDGTVYWIDISSRPYEGIQYYDLLTDYGEPSEIYIFSHKDFQTRPPWLGKGERPAYIIFYYAGEGIYAEYWFFGTLNENTNRITVCPTPTHQEMYLEPVGTEYSQNELSQIYSGGDTVPILKIDEATSLSKHDFYMRYKDKNQSGCFETPVSLWY